MVTADNVYYIYADMILSHTATLSSLRAATGSAVYRAPARPGSTGSP